MDILKSAIELLSSKNEDPKDPKKPKYPKRVVVFAERPIGDDLDNKAFLTEGQNVINFYKRVSPSTKVEILPVYETGDNKTKQKIQDTLYGLTPDDDVMVFGHHGSKYAGIPTEQWATLLQDSNYGNCYLGSCQSEDVAAGPWKNIRNLVYRPATPWKGFNPKGSDLISAMFSRGSTPPPIESGALYLPMPQQDQYESQAAFQRDLAEYERKVNEFNERSRRTLDIEKPILGVDYKVKPNPPKYQSNAEWITNPLFSGSRETGLPLSLRPPRPTAKKVDSKNAKKVQSTLSNKKKK